MMRLFTQFICMGLPWIVANIQSAQSNQSAEQNPTLQSIKTVDGLSRVEEESSPGRFKVSVTAQVIKYPILRSAEFVIDGLHMDIIFNVSTDEGVAAARKFNYSGKFSCSALFTFIDSNAATCKWASHSKITTLLLPNSSLITGDTISLNEKTIKPYCSSSTAKQFCPQKYTNTSSVQVTSPLNMAGPVISLISSSNISLVCNNNMILDPTKTNGHMGRNWLNVTWSVFRYQPGIGNIYQPNISFLLAQQTSLESLELVVVPWTYLSLGLYTVYLNVTNVFLKSSVKFVRVNVTQSTYYFDQCGNRTNSRAPSPAPTRAPIKRPTCQPTFMPTIDPLDRKTGGPILSFTSSIFINGLYGLTSSDYQPLVATTAYILQLPVATCSFIAGRRLEDISLVGAAPGDTEERAVGPGDVLRTSLPIEARVDSQVKSSNVKAPITVSFDHFASIVSARVGGARSPDVDGFRSERRDRVRMGDISSGPVTASMGSVPAAAAAAAAGAPGSTSTKKHFSTQSITAVVYTELIVQGGADVNKTLTAYSQRLTASIASGAFINQLIKLNPYTFRGCSIISIKTSRNLGSTGFVPTLSPTLFSSPPPTTEPTMMPILIPYKPVNVKLMYALGAGIMAMILLNVSLAYYYLKYRYRYYKQVVPVDPRPGRAQREQANGDVERGVSQGGKMHTDSSSNKNVENKDRDEDDEDDAD